MPESGAYLCVMGVQHPWKRGHTRSLDESGATSHGRLALVPRAPRRSEYLPFLPTEFNVHRSHETHVCWFLVA